VLSAKDLRQASALIKPFHRDFPPLAPMGRSQTNSISKL
jgi:hypothetical protein